MKSQKPKLYRLFAIVIVITLANTSCEGPIGPEGPQGPKGEQGPPGPVGPAGSDGSIIHAGQGAPNENTGKPGDFYLDLSTGNLFGPKMVEGWGAPLNLIGDDGPEGPQGPQGPQGPEGPQGPDGPQGPSGEDGEDGQDGEDGEDGKDGSQIYAGNSSPDSGLGKKGDYYLDRDKYDLYGPKTGSGWGSPINLQGPQGEQGPEGPAGTTDHGGLGGLEDDDHLQYLLVNGVRETMAGFAVTGQLNQGMIPTGGEGTRLMWYSGKAAFRAGNVDGTQWDDANIGEYSVAMGRNTMASGPHSTAMGLATTASGDRSTAMGSGTTASGNYSTAMGSGTIASSQASTSMGLDTEANGTYSTAMGWNTTASGEASTAMGIGTTAASDNSLSIGRFNVANTTDDNTFFVVGNGANFNLPSDALVLDFFGNLKIAGTLTENSDRRLKTDIAPLETGVLGKLVGIRPVRYRFKEGTGHPEDEQLGLIAQEVQAHFPELVSEGSDGYLSLSYSKFTTVLLKGMQEQQAHIERLEARLMKLEGEQGIRKANLWGTSDTVNGAASRWVWVLVGVFAIFLHCFLCHRNQHVLKNTERLRSE